MGIDDLLNEGGRKQLLLASRKVHPDKRQHAGAKCDEIDRIEFRALQELYKDWYEVHIQPLLQKKDVSALAEVKSIVNQHFAKAEAEAKAKAEEEAKAKADAEADAAKAEAAKAEAEATAKAEAAKAEAEATAKAEAAKAEEEVERATPTEKYGLCTDRLQQLM